MKAIALLSGGLDSTLAIRLIREQDIEVEALNFITLFCRCTGTSACELAAKRAARTLGVPVRVMNVSKPLLEIVKNPRHGYGKNLNPCIDCRILTFREAAKYMRENGASFIVTGEVLGQRPMSQRKEIMRLIEKAAGVEGLVVRPLCAKVLEPSIPERRGWVDRDKFLAIKGRSRKEQMNLASQFGIKDYSCPAGGCLLTDPDFAARMKDLLSHGDFDINDVHLLKMGRHFRLDRATKCVVGRDEADNVKIRTFSRSGDALLRCVDVVGPTTLVRGNLTDDNLCTAARITAGYTKMRDVPSVRVSIRKIHSSLYEEGEIDEMITVRPMSIDSSKNLRVGR